MLLLYTQDVCFLLETNMFNYTTKLHYILKIRYYFIFVMEIYTSHTYLKEDNYIYIYLLLDLIYCGSRNNCCNIKTRNKSRQTERREDLIKSGFPEKREKNLTTFSNKEINHHNPV